MDINPKLSPGARRQLEKLFLDTDVLSMRPGKISNVKFKLELKPGFQPKSSAPRAHGPAQTRLITSWIKEQVALGLYEPASPGCQWASPVHVAPTWTLNEHGERRLAKVRICGDYREVNAELSKVAQVVPLIGDIKQKLAGHRFYARFDMTAGFNAVELDPESRDVLTIRTPIGLFRPTRLPFGPKNNPSKYQKIIESLVNRSPHFLKGFSSTWTT